MVLAIALPLLLAVGLALFLLSYGLLVSLGVAVVSFFSLRTFLTSWYEQRHAGKGLSPHEAAGAASLEEALRTSAAEHLRPGATFLAAAFGNKGFSYRARRNHKEVSEFAFKTSQYKTFKAALPVAIANWKQYSQNGALPAGARKTTREELRVIESTLRLGPYVARVVEVYRNAGQAGLLQPQLLELNDLLQEGKQWAATLLPALVAASGLQTGDVVAYSLEQDRYYLGFRRSAWLQSLVALAYGAPISHVGLVLHEQGTLAETHMWGSPISKHTVVSFSIGTFGNEFFTPVFNNKIDLRYAPAIAAAYPQHSSYLAAIEAVYKEAFVDWHRINKAFLETVRNDASYRMLVALVINSFSLRELSWRERCQFRPDWIKPANQMSCSEFAIKAWLQVLDLTGRKLAEALHARDPSVPLDGTTVIPHRLFSLRRRFNRYSPGQLVYRAERMGGIRQLKIGLYDALFE
jgi:hypothetical protein